MRKTIAVLSAGAMSLALAPSAFATTDTVANKNDAGPGSLRAVVAAAAPGDTVAFAPSVTGTIALTTGPISIAKDLTIQGPGAGTLSLDAGGLSQILTISAGDFSISGLTLSHGQAGGPGGKGASSGAGEGGAIFDNSSGSLTVTDSVFNHDDAGGSGGGGSSSGDGLGGAISDEGGGSLTVTDSTFSSDGAGGSGGSGDFSGQGFGGAIYAAENGSLSVTGSTFTNDSAGGAGGAGADSGLGDGGAIFAEAFGQFAGLGPQLVSDSTLFANRAGGPGGGGTGSGVGLGGALDAAFPMTLQSSTVDGNSVGSANGSAGSGIYDAADVSALASIVSADTGAPNCDAPVATTSFSLEGPSAADKSCGFDLKSANPQLGPLHNNGGPTQTQALPETSPAIGAVPVASCPTTVDQRGLPRPDNEVVCDVGAYEFQNPMPPGPTPSPSPSVSPAVVIITPQPGATYTYGSVPASSFSCTAAASSSLLPGLAGCSASIDGGAPVASGTPLNGSVGQHTIVVTATDGDGHTATATVNYTVTAGPPQASITSPRDGAKFSYGSLPASSFSCTAGAGGSLKPGLSGCSASVDGGSPVGSAARLNGAVGRHTIVVTATGADGQTATATAHYSVVRAATRLHAKRQLLRSAPSGPGPWYVSATLTSSGKPVVGRTVVFTSGKTILCHAVTGRHGGARCAIDLATERLLVQSGDYTAAFHEDADYLASSGVAPVTERFRRRR